MRKCSNSTNSMFEEQEAKSYTEEAGVLANHDISGGDTGMQKRESIDYKIRGTYASLRKSEKKVADYVLANEIECSKISLEKLAKRSGVSQPTVMRFVKAMGFDGFKEFRYQIIEDLSERNHREKETYAMYGYPIRPEDDLKLIPAKVVASTVKIMENMLKSISGEEFEKTIHMLANARKIVLCGEENSSAAAKDLMTKLLYLGYDCRFDEDYYIQHISAAALTEKDVMVGISYSGQSKDTVDIMKAAKKAGAQTICITNFRESRIGKWSDVVLCSSQKQWMYGDCIFSRSPQIVINDMIYMGLMTNAYEKGTKQLDKNSRIIRDRAYEQ